MLYVSGGYVYICMGSSKIKAQGQSHGQVITTFMWYFLKEKTTIKI